MVQYSRPGNHGRPQLFWKVGARIGQGAPFDSSVYVVRFRPIQPVWGGGGAVRFRPIQPVGGGGGRGEGGAGRFNQ